MCYYDTKQSELQPRDLGHWGHSPELMLQLSLSKDLDIHGPFSHLEMQMRTASA